MDCGIKQASVARAPINAGRDQYRQTRRPVAPCMAGAQEHDPLRWNRIMLSISWV
jgi:hypothetical protein